MRTQALLLSASLLAGAFLLPPGPGSTFAQTHAGPLAADNTSMNQRDREHQTLTPIDQSNKPADVNLTREIRRALINDGQLSTYARNIKIITVDGAVTLRGPVRTEQEKADIAGKAARLAGDANVHNDLEIAGQ